MHIKRIATYLLTTVLTVCVFAQPVRIGEQVATWVESPHPYPSDSGVVFATTVQYPGARYIRVHFAEFNLAPGDYVIVSSPTSGHEYVYRDQGPDDRGLSQTGFFAAHVPGESALVELYSANDEAAFGFSIDRFSRGYSDSEIEAFWAMGLGQSMQLPPPPSRSICTSDDSLEAKCYELSEPQAYEEARGVARLLISKVSGDFWCSGFLIGCEGHLMTNAHCIEEPDHAANTDFEFMAEGGTCATGCTTGGGCPGTVEATSATLLSVNSDLDYSLMVPNSAANLSDSYGFLELRETGPTLDERIYIPQHPAGWGKRIALTSSYPLDLTGFPTVSSIAEPACYGSLAAVGYWADTQGGSSGSPVLAYADHQVVALHHCSGDQPACLSGNPGDLPNRGVTIDAIAQDIAYNLPDCAICAKPDTPLNVQAVNNGDNQIDVSWDVVAGASDYRIYRFFGNCSDPTWEWVDTAAGSPYIDDQVSGGSSYAYAVSAHTSGLCESYLSSCVSETATGFCRLSPLFDGASSVVSGLSDPCSLVVSWLAGSPQCGSELVYNIYRGDSELFQPDGSHLIASGVTGTSFVDGNVMHGTTYWYIVRAEDDSGNGSGPFMNGNQDENLMRASATVTGPLTISLQDDLEMGSGNWITLAGPGDAGTFPWQLSTAQSQSPVTSWICSDDSRMKDQLLEMNTDIVIPNTLNARLEFFQWFQTEDAIDGGVLEYSTNSGAQWQDILDGDGSSIPVNPGRFLAYGYTATLNPSDNLLAGRSAFTGTSMGWLETQVDLNDFKGVAARFRWRMTGNSVIGDVGWYLDDIRLLGQSACACDHLLLAPSWPSATILDFVACVGP